MEREQRDLIQKRKADLIQSTICNVLLYSLLQSKSILHSSDLDRLEARKRLEGEHAERSLFYDILLTRANSYQPLIDALESTNQTGVLAILNSIPVSAVTTTEATACLTPTVESGNSVQSKEYRNFVLGSKKCRIPVVVKVFEDSPLSAVVHSDWSKLARNLDTPGVKCAELRQELMVGTKKIFDVVNELLVDWKMRERDDATLGELIDILESMDWNTFAHDLEQRFGQII